MGLVTLFTPRLLATICIWLVRASVRVRVGARVRVRVRVRVSEP